MAFVRHHLQVWAKSPWAICREMPDGPIAVGRRASRDGLPGTGFQGWKEAAENLTNQAGRQVQMEIR